MSQTVDLTKTICWQCQFLPWIGQMEKWDNVCQIGMFQPCSSMYVSKVVSEWFSLIVGKGGGAVGFQVTEGIHACVRGQKESFLLWEVFLALGPSLLLWAKLLSFKSKLRSLYICAVKTCHIWFVSSQNVAVLCPTVAFNLAIQVYIDMGFGFGACIITNKKIYLTFSLVGHFKYSSANWDVSR